MENQKYLAIVILIGGKSIRFGYEKGTIEIYNKPLLLYQIETLAKFDEDIFISANSEEQAIKVQTKIDFPKKVNFIVDERTQSHLKEIYTPLLGIYSAFKELKRLGFQKAFTLSGDAPLIKSEVIKYMIQQAKGYDCVIPRWENDFLEPLFAIYPVDSTYHRAEQIVKEKKHFGLNKLIQSAWKINYLSVEKELKPMDPSLTSLININGPIDIQKVKNILKKEN
ncbi:MAG: putative molybdenum cofactor guanylyltransferase [Promethearchaeota archaeon]|nr:MAG: putative molybdenum cofactor guanylyltransferase [Candidatus Lokiarchaeota archaeon]